MPAEDHNTEVTSQEHIERELSFDALAKGLATGSVSRRSALKLMGGALLGGVLASIPGVAFAAPSTTRCRTNSDCPPNAVCQDRECVCPARTSPCTVDVFDCCGPGEICTPSGCRKRSRTTGN